MSDALAQIPVQHTFEERILERFQRLELEDPDDLFLLCGADLLEEPIDILTRDKIDREFPGKISTGDATYELAYNIKARELRLIQKSGLRKKPPPRMVIPRKKGWKMIWVFKNREHPLD